MKVSLMPWHIAVLIPARNEEILLPRCLRSVAAARRMLPPEVTSDVVLVSDRSDDRTADVAREMLGVDGLVLSTQAGVVGVARAMAADAALRHYTGPREKCWLANTDADCEVPEDWLLQHLAVAERGYMAVAGIVDVDSFEGHASVVESMFRLTYLIHEDGTHPHVHGANLGVRADAYLRAGGWMHLDTAEDHDLWNRLPKTKERLSDARLQVITSGRRLGRAPLGFAGALAAHGGASA